MKAWENPSGPGSDQTAICDDRTGGTSNAGDPSSFFPELWSWLIEEFHVSSMIDFGGGVGICTKFFNDRGVDAYCLDASRRVYKQNIIQNKFILHDFYDGAYDPQRPLDLVFSCEMLEHIAEEYLPNVIKTIQLCHPKLLVLTGAPKNAGGHHHVNCQNADYWIKYIETSLDNFTYHDRLTKVAKELSKSNVNGRCTASYFDRGGLIFTKDE